MQSVELGAVADQDQSQRPLDLFLIFAGANIVATTLQIGAWVAGLPFSNAMFIIALGAVAGAWLVAALAPIGSRLRVPSIVATRAVLGFQGAQVLALLLFLTNFAWIADNNVIAASIVARLVSGPSATGTALLAIVIGLAAMFTVLGGPRAVGLADRFAVPTLFLSGVAMTIACLRIPLPEPAQTSASFMDHVRAFDVPFGYQTTWLLMFADYSRYSRSPRKASWAVFGGLGITALWFIPLGLISSLISGSQDPGAMVFGLGLGWWGGALLLLGTLTTNFVNIYMSALALKSLRPETSDRAAIWLIGGVGAAMSVMDKLLIDQFANLIALLAGIFVPIGAILIAHFLILKRRHTPGDLYPSSDGRAPRVGLWSAPGMTAWIVGAAVFYLAAYPPPALHLPAIGGTVPSFLIALAIYLMVSRTAQTNSQ